MRTTLALTLEDEPTPQRRRSFRLRRRRQTPLALEEPPDQEAAAANPRVERRRSRLRFLTHLVSGALAGATAKTLEAPLDRVKIIFQVSKERFSLRAAAAQMGVIARSEGVQGLWITSQGPSHNAEARICHNQHQIKCGR